MTKVSKVTISGSYQTANGEVVDFEDITGIVPVVSEEKTLQYIRKRFAVIWVKDAKDKKGEKKFPKRIEQMRQVFIDNTKEIKGDRFSYVGKDIKTLSYQELQDLAIAKDLNRIPLPKEISGVSLRDMREMAYVEYSDKVLGRFIDINAQGFNFAKLSPIAIDGYVRQDDEVKMTNDEIIEQEQETSTQSTKSGLTLDDLKGIADNKNIRYHPNIGYDTLHAKLYG